MMHPLLQLAKRVDSAGWDRLDDSGPGLRGSVGCWVGDTRLQKGFIFTEHFRGEPCRIIKTGYNVKKDSGQ